MLLLCSTPASASDLRVFSFNVWAVPVISPDRPERVAEIARRMTDIAPDFVALQEVWEDEDAERLAPGIAAAGLTEQRHFGSRQVGGRGSGLWIASRYPIIGERFVKFDVGDQPYIHWHLDYLSSKGVALIDIETPKGPVTIANTHLQSTYTFGDYTFIQLAQALTVAREANVAFPLIVVGDINAESSSIVSEVLVTKLGLSPASRTLGIDVIMSRSTATTGVTVTAFEHLFEDAVSFPNGLRRTLSDHPALLADFELRPCTNCSTARTWADTLPLFKRFLDDNEADTLQFATLTKTLCIAFVPFAFIIAQVGRRRRPRGAQLFALATLVLGLLVTSTWLAYVSWRYAPYKLAIIAKLRNEQ